MTTGLPDEFVSEPFGFGPGNVLSVEAGAGRGTIGFRLEGSEDKTYWAELAAGTVAPGETAWTPCRGPTPPWARVRLRSSGGDARATVRVTRAGER